MRIEMNRTEEPGLLGTRYFLWIRALPTPEERAHIDRHRLGREVVYENYFITGGWSLLGLLHRAWLASRPTNVRMRVSDLLDGTRAQFSHVAAITEAEIEIEKALTNLVGLLSHSRGSDAGLRSIEIE